jgi:hypothetical protein
LIYKASSSTILNIELNSKMAPTPRAQSLSENGTHPSPGFLLPREKADGMDARGRAMQEQLPKMRVIQVVLAQQENRGAH